MKFSHNKGFTLVEALVAVSIFSFVVVLPLSIAMQSIASNVQTIDQTIALNLARDAIEFVNYARLENARADEYWLEGIIRNGIGNDLCAQPSGCRIDTSINPATVQISGAPPLRYDAATGLYGYNGAWTPTKFSRTIKVTGIDNFINLDEYDAAVIFVEVSWQVFSGVTKSVTMAEYLFNWVLPEA